MTELQKNGLTTASVATPSPIEETSVKQEVVVKPKTPTTDPGTPTPSSGRPASKGRKLLPSIPDPDTEAAMSASVNNKQNSIMTGGSGYGQFLLEYCLMAEYNQLHKHKLPGVYVIPSALTPLVWNGVLFIRQGLYQEGVFKFKLVIPENYPDGDCPQLVFETSVFHPVVDPKTGELDVRRAFQKWRRNVHQLWQVLLYARKIFYKIDTKCPLNEEAANLYEHSIEEFKQRVTESIRDSKSKMYESADSEDNLDPHAIRFTPWDSSVHEEARDTMLKLKPNNTTLETEPHKKNGLSWMKPGSTQIFSQDEDSGTF